MALFDMIRKPDAGNCCPACRSEISEGLRFCPVCGYALGDTAVTEKPEPEEKLNELAKLYMHDDDRKALSALKAIPGFAPLMRGFMKNWNEKQFRIENMSSHIRLGQDQMPKYYDMLLPICEKLQIEVPELYLAMNVVPNAYTYGDTKPFIVLTSGLLKTMPDELIPTVLAHECGHIACHHTLYTTMGSMILNGASILSEMYLLGKLISVPLKIAFFYWMRCSEYSADRAASVFNGCSDKTVDVCFRLAGYDREILSEGNVEAFMQQAVEYKEMISSSAWNKSLEFLMLKDVTHPFNAVRAYECAEWCKTEQFTEIMNKLK